MRIKNLKISWSVLFIGLQNDWLTQKEIVEIINSRNKELNCSDDLLIEFNVKEDDKKAILYLLKEKGEAESDRGIKYWQLNALLNINLSKKPIEEKL